MTEEWRSITDLPDVEVSSEGRVRRKSTGRDGKHFANVRFVDAPPPGAEARRLALLAAAPALAEAVAYLAPRVHRHLADDAKVRGALALVDAIAAADPRTR